MTLLPISVTFEMTDEVAVQAARETWLAFGRRAFTIPTVVLAAISGVIFYLSLKRDSPWLWRVLAGTAPILFVLMLILWGVFLWWMPRAMQRKLRHLPHRRVHIELSDAGLMVQTATEELRVDWTELERTRVLTRYCVVQLRAGAEFPIPLSALSSEALAILQSRARQQE